MAATGTEWCGYTGSAPDSEVVRGGHDLLDHEVGKHEGQKALGHGTT